jgi:hypothetical protein
MTKVTNFIFLHNRKWVLIFGDDLMLPIPDLGFVFLLDRSLGAC